MLAFIVEDEPVVQSSLATLLSRWAFEVTTYADAEAFAAVAPRSPYLLVVDKNLPGMSGLDLVTKHRELGHDFEAILITGYADISSAIEAVRLGLYSYLQKPFEMDVFLADVEGAAQRLRARCGTPPRDQLLRSACTDLQLASTELSALASALQQPDAPAAEEHLASMQSTLLNAAAALDRQLLVQRVTAGQVRADPVALLPCLHGAARQFAETARQQQKSIVVEAQGPVTVRGDAEALAQTVRWLVELALGHVVYRGLVILDLETRSEQAGLRVVAQAAENHRLTEEQEEKLTFCRRVAEAHGGRLAVESYLEGEGREYVLSLPLAPGA